MAAPPVLVLLAREEDIEAILRRVCVHVPNDLVAVATLRRRANYDGPVQGQWTACEVFTTPELDYLDGVVAFRDAYWVKYCWERIFCGDGRDETYSK